MAGIPSFTPAAYATVNALNVATAVPVPTTDPASTTALVTNLSPNHFVYVGYVALAKEGNGIPVPPETSFALDVTGQTNIYIANDGDPVISIPVQIAFGS